jgi:hypothetical protein
MAMLAMLAVAWNHHIPVLLSEALTPPLTTPMTYQLRCWQQDAFSITPLELGSG